MYGPGQAAHCTPLLASSCLQTMLSFQAQLRYVDPFPFVSKLCGTAKTEMGTDAELGRWVLTPRKSNSQGAMHILYTIKQTYTCYLAYHVQSLLSIGRCTIALCTRRRDDRWPPCDPAR